MFHYSILKNVSMALRFGEAVEFWFPHFGDLVSGVSSVGDPPVPIPNTVVKPYCGEDTWGKSPWENSATPEFTLVAFLGLAR